MPESLAGVVSPGAASMQAAVEPAEAGCFPQGSPQVIATHVAPRAGLTAFADGSRVGLRFATTVMPRVDVEVDPDSLQVVEGDSGRPSPATRAGELFEAKLDDGRGLYAWTEGSTYEGLHVTTQGFGQRGNELGAPVDLGADGSAIGKPTAALTAGGRGVLAFIESNGAGFQVVVTRLTCADPRTAG
jgi:hypothetical protein